MPLAGWVNRLFEDRIEFTDYLTPVEVEALVMNKNLKVLQCSAPVQPQTWDLLNTQFFTQRPDVDLRIYGFYTQDCDLSFTTRMTNVHRFLADCLMDASGIEHIAAMQKLEKLCIGIYNLESFDFLSQVAPHLKRLQLGRTRSKKPDLSLLSRFASLEGVYIEGHHKNIEVLSQLEDLREVTLRSISTPNICYLKPLCHMRSLDIKLGGITDINAIEGMHNIKFLELWQVRGLSDLGVISTLEGLQFLFLQSLRQVIALPPLDRLKNLRRIFLDNMKGLQRLDSIEFAPALAEFIHREAKNFQPEDYLPVVRNKNVKHAFIHFSNTKKEKTLQALFQRYGIDTSPIFPNFEFDR
jgi:hypothetical protein